MHRSLTLTLAGALCASASLAHANGVTLAADKPMYQAGDATKLTLTGPVGGYPFLMYDAVAGSYDYPGVGTIQLAVSPEFILLTAPPLDQTGQVSWNCTMQCGDPALDMPCLFQGLVITFPYVACLSNLVVVKAAPGNACSNCTRGALPDPTCQTNEATAAFSLPGIGSDFQFVGGTGQFTEYVDGTALLVGDIASLSNRRHRFSAVVHFANRLDYGDPGFVPAGSPKKELDPSCYVEGGGTIHTDMWHYYLDTTGTLTGLAGYAGASMSVAGHGPAFQVGHGANGRNAEYGASGWQIYTTVQQPTTGETLPQTVEGDINIERCPQ
jgi:hypothetical protein